MSNELTDKLKETYFTAFCFYRKTKDNQVKNWIRTSLYTLFDYCQLNKIDCLTLSVKEAEEFLRWNQKRNLPEEEYDRLTFHMIQFYRLLLEIEEVKLNPFQLIKERIVKELLEKMKHKFPGKSFYSPDDLKGE